MWLPSITTAKMKITKNISFFTVNEEEGDKPFLPAFRIKLSFSSPLL